MKKLMLSLAVMGCLAYTTATAQEAATPNLETVDQETTKIDPENLPEKVKEAIQNDENTKDIQIAEAHQKMKDNQVYYVVKFEKDATGNELKKKFNAMGEEVEDDEDEEKPEIE
ncbi:MAG: hypothetical protein WDZ72_09390 [Cyclobacteriaceae bacterium]